MPPHNQPLKPPTDQSFTPREFPSNIRSSEWLATLGDCSFWYLESPILLSHAGQEAACRGQSNLTVANKPRAAPLFLAKPAELNCCFKCFHPLSPTAVYEVDPYIHSNLTGQTGSPDLPSLASVSSTAFPGP